LIFVFQSEEIEGNMERNVNIFVPSSHYVEVFDMTFLKIKDHAPAFESVMRHFDVKMV
jgi:hypothetical protein